MLAAAPIAYGLMLLSVQAATVNPAQIAQGAACVLEQTSTAEVSAVGDNALAGEDRAGSEAMVARLSGYVRICSDRFGWDEATATQASILAITMMARRTAQTRLAALGLDPAVLDRWFDRQSVEFRTTAFISMPETALIETLSTLADHDVSLAMIRSDGELIGGYIATLVVTTRIERGLMVE